jgi:hypothetical protein
LGICSPSWCSSAALATTAGHPSSLRAKYF